MDKINIEDYYFMSEPISICVENNKGIGELGYLLEDNKDGTFKAKISYPFGDCVANIKKKDNSSWDIFEFVKKV